MNEIVKKSLHSGANPSAMDSRLEVMSSTCDLLHVAPVIGRKCGPTGGHSSRASHLLVAGMPTGGKTE